MARRSRYCITRRTDNWRHGERPEGGSRGDPVRGHSRLPMVLFHSSPNSVIHDERRVRGGGQGLEAGQSLPSPPAGFDSTTFARRKVG